MESVVCRVLLANRIQLCIEVFLTYSLFLAVHDGLKLLKVPQFDLQFLHLGLHQQSNQGLDLPLLYCRQMLKGRRWAHGQYLIKAK